MQGNHLARLWTRFSDKPLILGWSFGLYGAQRDIDMVGEAGIEPTTLSLEG